MSSHDGDYGLWALVAINSLFFILFAASYFKPRSKQDWRTLGLFSAFTLPYLLGPASPEMMGPYMQRTFSDNADPLNATTQAVITFAFCAAFGLIYVRAIANGRKGPA